MQSPLGELSELNESRSGFARGPDIPDMFRREASSLYDATRQRKWLVVYPATMLRFGSPARGEGAGMLTVPLLLQTRRRASLVMEEGTHCPCCELQHIDRYRSYLAVSSHSRVGALRISYHVAKCLHLSLHSTPEGSSGVCCNHPEQASSILRLQSSASSGFPKLLHQLTMRCMQVMVQEFCGP